VPIGVVKFAEFELDSDRYELRCGNRVLKLEKIPMELLTLLVEGHGQLVSRDEIVEKIWGKDVFLDTEHGINTAIRKIRHVLGDDPEQPRFVQTVTGRAIALLPRQDRLSRVAMGTTGRERAPLSFRRRFRPKRRLGMRKSVGRVKESRLSSPLSGVLDGRSPLWWWCLRA